MIQHVLTITILTLRRNVVIKAVQACVTVPQKLLTLVMLQTNIEVIQMEKLRNMKHMAQFYTMVKVIVMQHLVIKMTNVGGRVVVGMENVQRMSAFLM